MMATAFLGYVLPYGLIILIIVYILEKRSNFLYLNFNKLDLFLKYDNEISKENLTFKKIYINPVYKEDPLYYTSKGKIRKRFNNPFNYPKTKPKVENEEIPEKIQDILVGSLLGDCSGEMQKKGRYAAFAFKQSVKHKEYLFYIYFIFLH